MVRYGRLFSICVLFVFSNLVGCSSGENDPSTPQFLTFEPIPTSFAAGTCDITADFEEWLQSTTFRVAELREFVEDATGKTPSELAPGVQHIYQVTDRMAETPVVTCAIETNSTVMLASRKLIERFQAYSNGDREDLNTIIDESVIDLATAESTLQNLTIQLDAQHGR